MLSSVKFILKNRSEFVIRCEEFSLRRNGFGAMTGYEISGMKGNIPLYVDISEIAAVLQLVSDEIPNEEDD